MEVVAIKGCNIEGATGKAIRYEPCSQKTAGLLSAHHSAVRDETEVGTERKNRGWFGRLGCLQLAAASRRLDDVQMLELIPFISFNLFPIRVNFSLHHMLCHFNA